MLRLVSLLAVACSSVATAMDSSASIAVNPATNHFIDGQGRTRIFHGVNVVEKAAPYHPITSGEFNVKTSMVQKDFDLLNGWGMNIVRLGVMWNAVEPVRGVYNQTYIQVLKELVDTMGRNGIYTILDFHQDLFARKFCGDGIPNHIAQSLEPLQQKCDSIVGGLAQLVKLCKNINEYGFTYDKDGNPKDCGKAGNWFNIYMTPQVSSAFDKFYTSEAESNSLVQYFVQLAKAFKGSPYAIGFDLFNEPFPGDVYSKPWLLKGGEADRVYLQPLYEKIATAIRKEDDTKIMMYEPVQFPDTFPLFGGIVSNVGFTQAPGGKDKSSTNAMSYHIYCCEAGADICPSGDVDPKKDARCDDYVAEKFQKRVNDYKRLGGGGIITEFGACSTETQCTKEINRVAYNADKEFHSWAYWQYKFFDTSFYNSDGSVVEWKTKALSRTYAQAIMGTPDLMNFDTNSGAFRLTYKVAAGSANSEIYLNPSAWYPKGYKYSVTTGVTVTKINNYKLALTHSASNAVNSVVDFVLVPTTANSTGLYKADHIQKNHYEIKWAVEDTEDLSTIEIVLTKSYHWRKEIRVYSDFGEKLCEISLTKSYSESCKLSKPNDFLTGYRIELYKFNVFDSVPIYVDSFRSTYLGPLTGKRVRLEWTSQD